MSRELRLIEPSVTIHGYLTGLALRPEPMPRVERERVQRQDLHLLEAIRRGVVREEFRDRATAYRARPNTVVTVGKNYVVDAWKGITTLPNMKFHANGSGVTAPTAGDPTLQAEYSAGSAVRATGTTTNGASPNIFRTVGTVSFLANGLNVTEWGLFSATTVGTMFSRVTFTAIPVNNGDSIQWTYEVTVG